MTIDVVVPTVGRSSLRRLLVALSGQGPLPGRLLLVDDRETPLDDLLPRVPSTLRARTTIVHSGGRGPAAARNAGWRASTADWIAFMDDDVIPAPDWLQRVTDDLHGLPEDVAASQGTLTVPLPLHPTDWQRNVGGLESAEFITADMAFRRSALHGCEGFDERFPRAYREDAELACRLLSAGWGIARGSRVVEHPVPDAGRLVSVRRQAGNADDALLRALHGPEWRTLARVPPGRRPRHLAVTAAGAFGVIAVGSGRSRAAALALTAWLTGTAELALARIRPGPRTADEIATMLVTSALIPPVATAHWLRGVIRWRVLDRPRPLPAAPPARHD